MKYYLPIKIDAFWEIEIPDDITDEDEQDKIGEEMFTENQRQGVIVDPELNPKEAQLR